MDQIQFAKASRELLDEFNICIYEAAKSIFKHQAYHRYR